MTQTYFLGANSKDGFASLYRYFPGAEDAFLHIIKGGPGTGKSSFMRRIGRAAETRGLDVHYVLCSGDPDSLDGVYIPALHLAWVDGTAPHTGEPQCFGVDADYINLGAFCNTPFEWEDRQRILDLTQSYKALYADAYRELAALPAAERVPNVLPTPQELLDGIDEKGARPCSPARRFLHAISCQGELFLLDEIETLCGQVFSVPSSALSQLSGELELRKWPAIRCPSPLDPKHLDAILLPWAERAFVTDEPLEGLEPALSRLREAKELHDQLEAICRPYMDFASLTEFTEDTIQEVFDTV